MSVFSTAHITVISNDFSYMFSWHIFFLGIYKAKLPLFCKSL